MKKFYLGALFLNAFTSLFAQQNVQWQRDIQSGTQDFLSQLSITLDGQYLVSGSSIQAPKLTSISSEGGSTPNYGYDYHLIKLNQEGNPVWEKYYAGNNHDMLTATVATQEGGFLLAGSSYSSKSLDKKGDALGGSDIWLVKISDQGNEEWQRTLGSAAEEETKAVVQTTDLSYFVSGSIGNITDGFGSKDAWIIKLDKTGKPTKEIVLGGNGVDEIQKMIPTEDGGVLIGIYSRSGSTQLNNPKKRTTSRLVDAESENPNASTQNNTSNNTNTTKNISISYLPKNSENYGEGDYWVVKLDKEGNLQWQKNFGGSEDDHLRTMALTGNGYMIGGESRSKNSGNKTVEVEQGTDIWLVALDKNGNEQFQKTYNFNNRDVLMSLNSIWNRTGTQANGFLLGGYSQAEGRIEKDDETFWMLYLNDKGEEVWRKYIKGESRKKEERLVSASMLRDGSYILAGTSAKELGKENWKIVKLGDKQVKDLIETQAIRIYPNPVQDYCYVEIGLEFKDATIDLFDMSGRHIQSTATRNRVTKINTQPLIQGAYIVTVKTETKTANVKLIKK